MLTTSDQYLLRSGPGTEPWAGDQAWLCGGLLGYWSERSYQTSP